MVLKVLVGQGFAKLQFSKTAGILSMAVLLRYVVPSKITHILPTKMGLYVNNNAEIYEVI